MKGNVGKNKILREEFTFIFCHMFDDYEEVIDAIKCGFEGDVYKAWVNSTEEIFIYNMITFETITWDKHYHIGRDLNYLINESIEGFYWILKKI